MVVDPSAAAVPSANVIATNQLTGIKYSTSTNDRGNYFLRELPEGRYEFGVEASGFRRYVSRDVVLAVAQTLTLDVTMEIGELTQQVEVSAQAVALQSSKTEMGTAITRERVSQLPLSVSGGMRNPESFVRLMPGVTGTGGNLRVSGSQANTAQVLYDGVNATANEVPGRTLGGPSVEALSEFALVTSGYSAEYGRTGAGVQLYTTRSGTNTFHGAAFDYFRNDLLDARGFFQPTPAVNRQNEYGASIGGPVRIPKVYDGRNKTFFYFVFSGFRYRRAATSTWLSLPPTDFRSGDFSGLADSKGLQKLIYDPTTTRSDGKGGFTRDPFPGNRISPSRFSPVSGKIIPLIAPTTNAAALNNYLSAAKAIRDKDTYSVKIDHVFSERHRIAGFLYKGEQLDIGGDNLPPPLSSAMTTKRPAYWPRLNYTFIISPSTLLNITGGYSRDDQVWRSHSADQGWPTKIGLTGVETGATNKFPVVNFTDGYTSFANEIKTVGNQLNESHQYLGSISKIYGKHSFKIGGDVRLAWQSGADRFSSQGNFSFSSFGTAMPTAAGRANTGNAFASFLLGDVQSAEMSVFSSFPFNRYNFMAAYIQDDWKVTRKLTINWGLRYDLSFPRTEKYGNLSGFDARLPNPGAGNHLGALAFLGDGPGRTGRSSFADTYYKNFGPRLGFAYLLTPKTVLRTAYGIYYSEGLASVGGQGSQNFNVGFNARPVFSSTDSGVTPAFNWSNGFPQDFARPPFIDPAVGNGTNIHLMSRADGVLPYYQTWLLSIQRELPNSWLIEAAYVGSKGTRLGTGLVRPNEVDPAYLPLGALLSKSIDSPEARAANIPYPYAGFKGSVAQALRPYPQYLHIYSMSNPNGNSTYHGLQMKAERRMFQGLSALVSYTFSKTLTDSSTANWGGPTGQTTYNRRPEKGLGIGSLPHVLTVSYVYELPFGRGKAFLNGAMIDKLVGGWSLTGILTYSSGELITPTVNNTLPLFNSGLRPDVVSGVDRQASFSDFDPAVNLYINRDAFSVPAPYTFGNAARSYSDLRAFPTLNEDMGLLKNTALGERVNLVFRAEFFNVFNRTPFSSPASNLSNVNFGKITGQGSARIGQLALRLEF